MTSFDYRSITSTTFSAVKDKVTNILKSLPISKALETNYCHPEASIYFFKIKEASY